MSKTRKVVDALIKEHLDHLFADVNPTQQLFDFKEELTSNLREKVADYQSRGLEPDQAFKEAVTSMGDLSGLVADLRALGQDPVKQSFYTNMTTRIATVGIVAGVLLILFGAFTGTILHFMGHSGVETWGTGIFVVTGGALLTYSVLTFETRRKYAMNKLRAALYALSVGVLLFGLFAAMVSRFSTGETYIAVASLMIFTMAGTGLLLFLLLTGSDRRKP